MLKNSYIMHNSICSVCPVGVEIFLAAQLNNTASVYHIYSYVTKRVVGVHPWIKSLVHNNLLGTHVYPFVDRPYTTQ